MRSYQKLQSQVADAQAAGADIRIETRNNYYAFETKNQSRTLATALTLRDAYMFFAGYTAAREKPKVRAEEVMNHVTDEDGLTESYPILVSPADDDALETK